MYFQVDVCCLCLNRSSEKFHHLNDFGVPPDVSYYEKINLSLSKLDFKNEYAKDYMLCKKCCSIIDNIYEFNNSSIRNIDIMTQYMTLLSLPSNKRCKLAVELLDCCKPIIFNEQYINLEDTITSKRKDAVDHNTKRRCEIMQDISDIILHHPDDACISTVEIVNDEEVENNENNVKVVNEAPNVKIRESEVVGDCLKHADEKSDINNTHTHNRDCINLEGGTTGVTDVMVHGNVPVSDSLHANDNVILHQQKVAYGELVNYVKVEYNDGDVEEECIKPEERADGTPVCVGNPIIIDVKVENNEINVNKVVNETCVDDIHITEELIIKIEEPEVVADYLKHTDKLSDINSTHPYNRDCISFEDDTTHVTDVIVHDNATMSDSLHNVDDAYVLSEELVNDVKMEFSEEVYIKTEYADGTPGFVGDPISTEEDKLLPHTITEPSASRVKKHNISIISEKGKDKGDTERVKRKRCRMCIRKGKGRKQTIYHCLECTGKPGLCVECFNEYHEL